jgi:glycosyltransferase involved in cell wall biosynthesis
LRYWILTTEFPPFYGGGISTYCEQTSRMLANAGHEVTVFVPHYQSENILESVNEKVRLIRFNPSTAPSIKFLGFEANLSLAFSNIIIRQIEKEGQPDILESQEYNGIAYYLLQKKHLGYEGLQGLKVLITLHAPTFLYFDYNQVPLYKHPNFWTGEMERFCIRAADMCISPSAYLVEELKSRVDLNGIPLHVLPNPFESDYLLLPVPEYNAGEVIFYGKLIPQKGCIELFKYFAELWEDGIQIPLRLIGGGKHFFHPLQLDLAEHLQKKYKKYADAGLLILDGEISPTQLSQKLGQANVILVPSIVDNLPYTVLEAMSVGKIVLASKQGGQSEVIDHGIDGFLFDHASPGSFRESLLAALALSKEATLGIGKKAKEKIKSKYSYQSILPRKLELLQKIVDRSVSPEFPLIRPVAESIGKRFVTGGDLLTVVIPYYNMGAFLGDALRSIKASDYPNIAILIVNDGSKDPESIRILKDLEMDQQIRQIHKSNEGLSLARNSGALQAKGDYLAFLDPDDTVEPDYYSKAIALLKKKENISFAGCWARYFGESNNTWPAFNPEPPYVLLHNCMNTSAMVYKKDHFLDAGLNDARMVYGMEDYDSMLSMLAKGYRGVAFPEVFWNYRVRKRSMAQSFTLNSKLYLYKLIAEKHAAFYSQHASALFLILNSNGPSVNIDNPTLNAGIYSKFASSATGRRLVSILKGNKYLRRVALFVYKKL